MSTGGLLILKIGIIIYSQTENTYSVGQRLEEKLASEGHTVVLERITPVGDVNPRSKDIDFKNAPEIQYYDALIFGSPVHAFSLAPAMRAYLEQVESLNGKDIACFVTKGLRFKWTGGTRAIGQMKKLCTSKDANVVGTGIIVWNKNRDKEIEGLLENFAGFFKR